MKYYFRFLLSIACGVLLSPATCLATCTSSLVSTPNFGPGNSGLAGIGGTSSTDVWAVGAGGPDSDPLVEHFDGATWSVVPSPSHVRRGSSLAAVTAVSQTDAWAVGGSSGYNEKLFELSEHWNGSKWTIIPTFNSSYHYLAAVSSVLSNPASVWAVGGTFIPNCRYPLGCGVPVAKYWSPEKRMWITTDAALKTINANLSGVVSVSGEKAWAVGSQLRMKSGGQRALIEHWTGNKWTVVAGAITGGGLSAIAALSDKAVWAVGWSSPYYYVGPLVEHWDGSNWKVVKSPFPSNAHLDSVSVLSASDAWIGGEYAPDTSTNAILPVLAHFDGTSWSLVATPSNGFQSSIAGLYQTSAETISVGTASPALNYNQITFAALSHC